MIYFASKYIYFLLILAFLSIIMISQLYSGESIGKNIIYIFTILLLPFIDISIENIKSEAKQFNWKLDGVSFLKFVLAMIIVIFAYKKGGDVFTLGTILFFALGFLFRLNSRIAFFISLFCFSYVGMYMLIDQKSLAEKVSVYAYYFLIIGVILQIRQTIEEKKNNILEQ